MKLLAGSTALCGLQLSLSIYCSAQAQTIAPGALSLPAAASDSTAGAAEVIVTGSRIARRDYVSESPLVTVGGAALQTTPPANLETLLDELPQFAASYTGTSNNPSNRGRAQIDLRGLGPSRTLVLIDGYRFTGSQAGADISVIPTNIVQSFEVITGGASAAYGSDAIAGVVNIKTYPSFSGLQTDAEYGETGRGDGASTKIGLLAGGKFADDRGSAVFAFEYFDRESVQAGARSFATQGTQTTIGGSGAFQPSGTNLPSQSVVNAVFAKYGVAAGSVTNSASLLFNNDGSLFTATGGAFNYRGTNTSSEYISGGNFYTNPNLETQLQIPETRYTTYGRFNYDLTSKIQVYGLFDYSNRTDVLGLSPVVTTGAGLSIPVNNPFIPADLAQILASRPSPTLPFAFQKRFLGFGDRNLENDETYYQLAGGARGDIGFKDWTFNAQVSRAVDSTEVIGGPLLSKAALATLLSASDGGASLCSGGLNPFGEGAISQSCQAYITRSTRSLERFGLVNGEADVQGTIVPLPAGPLKFSAGYEYQQVHAIEAPDGAIAAGDIIGFGFPSASTTTYSANEFYGELLIPLLSNLPLVKSLDANVGYRYSDYSNIAKGIYTYKMDGDWVVTDWLRLRGGFQKAIRVPSATSLIAGSQQNTTTLGTPTATGNLGDPCDIRSSARNGSQAAQVAALCQALGVPSSIINTYQFNGAVVNLVGGNPTLGPERSDTYSIGAVVQSKFSNPLLSHITATIDYFNIDISGYFGSISANTALNDCLNVTGLNTSFSPTNYYCQQITRSTSTGAPISINSLTQNLGSVQDSGVDADITWKVGLGALGLDDRFGALTLDASLTRLIDYRLKALPGTPYIDYTGTIGAGPDNAFPRWKGYTSLTYDWKAYSLTAVWRYIDGMKDQSLVGAAAGATATSPPSVNYFDFLGVWKVRKNLELRLGVYNLTNVQPPLFTSFTQFYTDPSTYDVLGRRFTVALKAKY